MATQTTQAPQHDEVQEWIGRFNHAAANSAQYTAPSPPGAREWKSGFFGCLEPIDTCAITCCCPCVTFGQTHHRLRVDSSMKGYSPVNTSCIGWFIGSFCCINIGMQMLQRHEIKEKFGLSGNFVTDCVLATCCRCCDLIQQDKEAQYHLLNAGVPLDVQPGMNKETMVMEPQNPNTIPASAVQY